MRCSPFSELAKCPAPAGAGHLRQREQLEKRIADLKARLPKHSIPPAMLIELEELEEELEQARAEVAQENPQ